MLQFTQQQLDGAVDECQDDFYSFSRWMFAHQRGFKWLRGSHHSLVCSKLEAVFRGECPRLIINIPPRYSKTQLLQYWIAWCLGHVPDSEFIYASYSGDLAANNSWQTKEIVSHPEYHRIFPKTMLRADSQARSHWRTSAGGVVYAAGAGGTITGFGGGKLREGFGGALIIDDPHKVDEIRSDDLRKAVPAWFQNTFESRKNSQHTPIILIMQRLAEDDLSGWLEAGHNGEKWEVLNLPALCEDAANDPLGREVGEALWPEKHTAATLRQMQDAAPYMFAGQYQQRPSPAEGNIFRPDQIQIIEAIPAGPILWAAGWDFASSLKGDWSVRVKIGRLQDGRYIIAPVVRFRAGPDERDKALVNTAALDGRSTMISIPQDPGQAGKTQVVDLSKKLAGYRVKFTPESGDKITRAEPFASQVNVGNVLMLAGDWNVEYIEELRIFPNGKYDDQVDASSRAFAELIGKTSMRISSEAVRRA